MNKTLNEYLDQKQKDPVVYNCENCGKPVTRNGKSFKRNPHFLCKSCYMLSQYGVTSNIAKPEAIQKAK